MTLKEQYQTGLYNCVVRAGNHIVISKFNGFNGEALLTKDDFEFGYSESMKSEYIKIHDGSHIIYANEWEGAKFYLLPIEETLPVYLRSDYQFELGDNFYHIDEPNHKCEVVKVMKDYAYLLIPNPSICKAFIIRTVDINKTFFDTREKCLDARISRLERNLKLEKSFKERKM